MWNFASHALTSIRMKRSSTEPILSCAECSDDEVCSNASRDEALECPICWESFNIVENVPYVLWCGHSLCKNCVFGLQWAVMKFPTQQVKIPFFITCPWCHLIAPRIIYKGNLKYPRKNYFLLWMVESLNGDRHKAVSTCVDSQPAWSPKCNFLASQGTNNYNLRRPLINQYSGPGRLGSNSGGVAVSDRERNFFSLHKSLDFFLHFTSKFPLVIIFLLIAFFAIPCSAVILIIYFLLTIFFAIPSFLILYFAYPTIQRLVREITS